MFKKIILIIYSKLTVLKLFNRKINKKYCSEIFKLKKINQMDDKKYNVFLMKNISL